MPLLYHMGMHHRRSIRLKGYDYSQEGLYFITINVQDRECLFGEIVIVTNNDSPRRQIMILNDAGKIAEQCWLAIPQHFPNVILHEYVVMPDHVHGIIEITKNVGETVGAKKILPDDMTMVDDIGAKNDAPNCDVTMMGVTGAKNISPDDMTMVDNVGAKNDTPNCDVTMVDDIGAKNDTPNCDVTMMGVTGAKNISPGDDVTMVDDIGAKNISPLRSPSRTIGSIVRGFKIGVTKWFVRSVWQRNYYEHIIRSADEYERIAEYIINNPAKWHRDKSFK